MKSPEDFTLWLGASRTDEGLSLPSQSNASVKDTHSDGAIRAVGTFDRSSEITMRARKSKDYKSRYELILIHNRLLLVKVINSTRTTLFEKPMRRSLAPGDRYDIELRLTGPTLTVRSDSVLVGEARDETLTEGAFDVTNSGNGTAAVDNLFYLPLDGLPQAEALKLAGVSAPAAPQWLASDFATLTTHQIVDRRLHLSSYRAWMPDKTVRPQNVVMRASLIWKTDTRDPKLNSRYLATGDGANLQPTTAWFARFSTNVISIGITDGKDSNMRSIPLNPPIQVGDKVTLKFASIGHRHLAWVNEKLAGDVMDERLIQNGPVRLSAGEALFDSFEYLPLDGLPEAEALKAAEMDAGAKGTAFQTPAPKAAAPSTEPWQDVLRDPKQLVLDGKAERTPEGLRFTGYSKAMRGINRGPRHDGAVRMLMTFGENHAEIYARSYRLAIYNEKRLDLGWLDGATMKYTTVRVFLLKEALRMGQEYELELRVVGQTLAVKLDGELLGTATDSAKVEGDFGLQLDKASARVLIKKLEVLDLDAPGSLSAPPSAEP